MLAVAGNALTAGQEPAVDSKFSSRFTFPKKTVDGQKTITAKINAAGLQKSIDDKGLYSIVSSQEMTPAEEDGVKERIPS